MARHLGRCAYYWAWALAGALLTFSVLSLAVGILVAPVALGVALLAARSSPSWPEPLGLIAGVGVTCLLVAGLGGVDAGPWLAAGPCLTIASVAAYATERREL